MTALESDFMYTECHRIIMNSFQIDLFLTEQDKITRTFLIVLDSIKS